jgi:aspartyl protease
MSLLFPYKVVPVHHSVVSLRGRWSRPRPLITVSVVGSSAAYPLKGLLDSGADNTVFHESVALRLGIDLSNTSVAQMQTATLRSYPVRYAPTHLRITDGVEQREWPAWVGFTPAPLNHPLLGFAGFLQYFTAMFHGDREQVELTVNSLYPGT